MRALFFSLSLLLFLSCGGEGRSYFSVTTYNAYALFDSIQDGDEFTGFSKSSGYSTAVYEERIKNLAVFIGKYINTDVIFLQEVESEIVLADLLDAGLLRLGYKYYALSSDDTINIALISKIEPVKVLSHAYKDSRAVLEAVFSVGGDLIHIFSVHLRSRLDEDNVEIRKEEMEHVKTLIGLNDGFNIILGDFNIDARVGEEAMAMLADKENENAVIKITGDPGRTGEGVMYSPFFDTDLDIAYENGTYYYEGEWYFYDYILLPSDAFDGMRAEFYESSIINPAEATDLYSRPLKFDISSKKGYSDHFPVKLVLTY